MYFGKICIVKKTFPSLSPIPPKKIKIDNYKTNCNNGFFIESVKAETEYIVLLIYKKYYTNITLG